MTFNDLGVNARLTYTLAERDREYFYISTVDATNTSVQSTLLTHQYGRRY